VKGQDISVIIVIKLRVQKPWNFCSDLGQGQEIFLFFTFFEVYPASYRVDTGDSPPELKLLGREFAYHLPCSALGKDTRSYTFIYPYLYVVVFTEGWVSPQEQNYEPRTIFNDDCTDSVKQPSIL
jgi:hypothetical protein